MSPKVSIIIPTFNRKQVLQDTIDKLVVQDYPDYEIIIVSQKYEVQLKTHPKVKHYHLPKANLPKARNFGISKATGEFFLFLDDDIIPSAHLIEHHVHSITKGYGAVVGKVIDDRGPGTREKLIQYNAKTGEYITDFGRDKEEESLSLAGGNSSYQREIFEKLQFDGFFNLTAHWEEVDLAFRMRKMGYKILFQPKAEIIHLKAPMGGCRNMSVFTYHYSQFKNSTLMYLKHSQLIHIPYFLIFQKNLLEYISRKKEGGHSKLIIASFLLGISSGALFYLFELLFFRSRLSPTSHHEHSAK